MIHNFGLTLKRLRKKLGWSQTALAKASGVSTAAVSKIESQSCDPCLSTFINIGVAFNLSLDDLADRPILKDDVLFCRQFASIKDLNETDRRLILAVIERLLKDQ